MARTSRAIRKARGIREARPPMRGGINATPVTLPDEPWETITQWAAHRFGADGELAVTRGDLFYDFARPVTPTDPYRRGVRVWIFRPVPDEPDEPIMFDVVARTDNYIVIDKPHDLATIPRGSHVARTVTVAARRQFANDDLVPAHRLDAETAGLVLLTTHPEARGPYQKLFERREVSKRYQAVAPVVDGFTGWTRVELRLERGRVPLVTDVVAGEPNAVTDMRIARVLNTTDEAGRPLALWEMKPLTGKTHQLRVTLNYLGAPIVGDPLYPRLLTFAEMDERDYPLQLHACELGFTDPLTCEELSFVSRRELGAAR